jgi:hypothetical protein
LLAHSIAAHLHDTQGAQAAARSVEALAEAQTSMRAGAPRASVPDEIRAWVLANCKNASGAALKDLEYAQAAMK